MFLLGFAVGLVAIIVLFLVGIWIAVLLGERGYFGPAPKDRDDL
jgi:uncharacterized membrane protein YiaA